MAPSFNSNDVRIILSLLVIAFATTRQHVASALSVVGRQQHRQQRQRQQVTNNRFFHSKNNASSSAGTVLPYSLWSLLSHSNIDNDDGYDGDDGDDGDHTNNINNPHRNLNDDTTTAGTANNNNNNNNNLYNRRRALLSFTSTPLYLTLLATTALPALPQPADASTKDPKTGILLPSVGEIENSIPRTWDDEIDNPLSSSSSSGNDDLATTSFARLDSSPDALFYSEPRFVEHVDEAAVDGMTSYVSDRALNDGDSVLDLCSSWTSHIRVRKNESPSESMRVAGLGMNAEELRANAQLTEWTVLDLNADGNVKLPYDEESFDVILLQLSIDYLIHPLEVLREASRVLKKGGSIHVLFSNRLFLSKAIGLWTGSDDIDKAYTVGGYLHYCGEGMFVNVEAEDLSRRVKRGKERVIVGDPLYVVRAIKG